jgi:hypothetical protein
VGCEIEYLEKHRASFDKLRTGRAQSIEKNISNFGLRNWEPARRVGVRRTNCECKNKESGDRSQESAKKRYSVFYFLFWLLNSNLLWCLVSSSYLS